MTTLTLDSLITQHPDHVHAEVDGEVLMMHFMTGAYFNLDEVGSFIWRQISQPMTIKALCDAIQSRYDVDRQTCEKDTFLFVEDLLQDGLITILDSPDHPRHDMEPRS